MPEPTLCCRALGGYCDRCDLLVGLQGLHVIGVDRDDGSGALTVTVESKPEAMGCRRAVSSRTVTAGGRCAWSMPRGWVER